MARPSHDTSTATKRPSSTSGVKKRPSSKSAPKRVVKRPSSARGGRESEAAVDRAKRAVRAVTRAAKAATSTRGDPSSTTGRATAVKASRLRKKRQPSARASSGTDAKAKEAPTKLKAPAAIEEEAAAPDAHAGGEGVQAPERRAEEAEATVPPPEPRLPTPRSPTRQEVQDLVSDYDVAVSAERAEKGSSGEGGGGRPGNDHAVYDSASADIVTLRTRLLKTSQALQTARDMLDAADRANRATQRELVVLRSQVVTQVRRSAHLQTLLEEEHAKRLEAERATQLARSEAAQAANAAPRGSPRKGSPRKGRGRGKGGAGKGSPRARAEAVSPQGRSRVRDEEPEARREEEARRDHASSHAAESFNRKLGDLRESQSMLELQLERLKAVLSR